MSLFDPPMVAMTNLTTDQKQRAAALLVATKAHPGGTVTDLVLLAQYVVQGLITPDNDPPTERAFNPMELFGNRQMDLDPVHRVPNFGDPVPEDDGLG